MHDRDEVDVVFFHDDSRCLGCESEDYCTWVAALTLLHSGGCADRRGTPSDGGLTGTAA